MVPNWLKYNKKTENAISCVLVVHNGAVNCKQALLLYWCHVVQIACNVKISAMT